MAGERQGTPVWFELTTPDQDCAQGFYETLAGWTVEPSPMPEHGGYRVAYAAGVPVAGIMAPPPGTVGMPGWTIHFAVADVDEAARRVGALGGARLVGPIDIPHVGRFAIVSDPQGIAFSLLAGSGNEPSRAFCQTADSVGHGVWIELASPDPDDAFRFYGALFGWTRSGGMPMGDLGEYSFIGRGDEMLGAIMPSGSSGVAPHWNWYVRVADIDAAVKRAVEGGATLVGGPDPIPDGELAANLDDPDGRRIGLIGPRRWRTR